MGQRWQSCPAFNSFEILFAEAWTAKARCPQGSQVEKFRSFENRALEDPGQQNKQPQPLATWHAQRKHRFFLIEFPLDLERVAPFPAGSYGENPWKVATEARTKLITLRKKSRKKDQRSKSRKAALQRRFNLFQAGQLGRIFRKMSKSKMRQS